MLNVIQDNPYRILGVWSNAPLRTIHANTTRLKALARVGKDVAFESDLTQVLPPIKRDNETLKQAIAALNLPQDKLRHALFWFINSSDIDGVALGHLVKGNTEHALKIFSMKPTFSSQINSGVLQFVLGDNRKAIDYIFEVIHSTSYRIDFVKEICGEEFKIKESELSHLFIDELTRMISANELVNLIKNEDDKKYCINKMTDEIVSRINAEIEKAKSATKESPLANLEVGKLLMNSTKSDLLQLKDILSSSSLKYKQAADGLAERILQCAINYFNDAENCSEASEVIRLAEYASQIAEGDVVKERCRSNLSTIQNEINTLPPTEVSTENENLLSLVQEFKKGGKSTYEIESFIKKSKKQLKKIRKIIGETHPFFLRVSTSICNTALNAIVDNVNSALDSIETFIPSYNSIFYGYDVDAYNARVRSHNASVVTARRTMSDAWKLTKKLEKFEVEEDFCKRLKENKESLRNLCNNSKVSTDFKDNVLFHKYSKSVKRFNDDLSNGSDDMGCLGWLLLIPLIIFVLVWIIELLIGCIIKLSSKEYKEEHIKSILILLASVIVVILSIVGINWYNS